MKFSPTLSNNVGICNKGQNERGCQEVIHLKNSIAVAVSYTYLDENLAALCLCKFCIDRDNFSKLLVFMRQDGPKSKLSEQAFGLE